jgi:hypothetical protein
LLWYAFPSLISRDLLNSHSCLQPWTEASKALQPEWVSTASKSKEKLITIDCTVEASLCKEQDVVSYPAIRLYRSDGRMSRYRGPKRASAYVLSPLILKMKEGELTNRQTSTLPPPFQPASSINPG